MHYLVPSHLTYCSKDMKKMTRNMKKIMIRVMKLKVKEVIAMMDLVSLMQKKENKIILMSLMLKICQSTINCMIKLSQMNFILRLMRAKSEWF